MGHVKQPPNKSRDYFINVIKVISFIGSQNYWFEDLQLPSAVDWFRFCLVNLVTVSSVSLILLQWGFFFTSQNLTEKESFNSKLFAFLHPLSLYAVFVTEKNKTEIGLLLKRLVVTLKEIYNDEEVEMQMLKRSKFVLKGFSLLMATTIVLYGLDGLLQVLRGQTFVTIITAWPNVEDTSTLAKIARFTLYIFWALLFMRCCSVFIIVIPLTICLSHQYINLRSYFERLNSIFLESGSQTKKELKFEIGFKVGLRLHAETLVCVHELQKFFNIVYGGHVINKSVTLIALMTSMANGDRSFSNLASTINFASYTLISLGCLVWNAGDITVEATKLPSAIVHSGWHYCSKESAVRIRPLVVLALQMSQKPVVLRCLGFVELSYGSYVSIVKSCYSGFSVLY